MTGKAKRLETTVLETERLIMKPVSPLRFARQTLHWTSDSQALSDLALSSGGWTLMKWWKQLRKLNRKNRLTHGIWAKGEDRPIGLHMVYINPQTGDAVTGILIGERQWRGKGVAVEAKREVITDLFERCGAHRITSWVNARNFASIHMSLRLGFTQEAQMREQAVLLDGSRADFLGYGLLRKDWNAKGSAPAGKGGA